MRHVATQLLRPLAVIGPTLLGVATLALLFSCWVAATKNEDQQKEMLRILMLRLKPPATRICARVHELGFCGKRPNGQASAKKGDEAKQLAEKAEKEAEKEADAFRILLGDGPIPELGSKTAQLD